MKEYIVSLNKDVDYDSFWNEIESISDTDGFVPSRRVEIVNNRNGSLRCCHYSLTDDEAEILKNDPRVYSVEIPPDQRTDIKIGLKTTQTGNFNKTTSSQGDNINWGLVRHIFNSNIYGTGTTTNQKYQYNNDGTGVDIVIMDSGIQADHPEFKDSQGVSRVQLINWYTASQGLIVGTQNPNHYRDYDGHGTHVAGIAAGITYGWAKNSRIYALKVNGLEGSGDENTGININDSFDLIKLWHRNKPVDPVSGYKRPTVVNMSFGYSVAYSNITGGVYRGVSWTGNTRQTQYGMTGYVQNGTSDHPYRVGSIDVNIEEMIDEGIIVCIAAGNELAKVDAVNGLDYNNYYTRSDFGGAFFYQRGMSPYSSRAIIVGALDITALSSSLDQKAWYSNCGEGVHIFAAGSNIMSCTSTINSFGNLAQPYYLNTTYKQLNISGTSMASPQIAGLASLYLQNNLNATPAAVKNWLTANSTSTVYKTSSDNDYTVNNSQWGGDVKVAHSPLNTNSFYKGDSGKITNMQMRKI